jgi:hypothetical protein
MGNFLKIKCPHCGKRADKPTGHVQRARKLGMKVFCSRLCSGLAKRKGKTKAQKREKKRLYDLGYRANNLTMLKAKKRDYHKRTYDPIKAAKDRKKTMARHIEYCRQPWYKAYKREYDKKYLASEYGEYADVFLLVKTLDREIQERMSNEEIHFENKTFNKKQRRAREEGKSQRQVGRPRFRDRRANH